MDHSVPYTVVDIVSQLNQKNLGVVGRSWLGRLLNRPTATQWNYVDSNSQYAIKVQRSGTYPYVDLYIFALGRTHDEYSNILLTLFNRERLVRKYYYLDNNGFVSFADLPSGSWIITFGLTAFTHSYSDTVATQELKEV